MDGPQGGSREDSAGMLSEGQDMDITQPLGSGGGQSSTPRGVVIAPQEVQEVQEPRSIAPGSCN